MDIDLLLAQRLRTLRKTAGLTLEQLAERSGVSRSMISLIERQETSPTAAVLNKLAGALGVDLATLFDTASARGAAEAPLRRAHEQPVWTDPATGYLRRQLSPRGPAFPLDLVEVVFPPGQSVLFENADHVAQAHQVIWLLQGQMHIAQADQTWRLQAGDCLALQIGTRLTFHNPGPSAARYALALAAGAIPSRNPL